ncbi:MAG TPA: hypothetical protein VHR18_05020 [Solirubrobacterales bacterium]|nr:hypothetical protein [Solirubrobacterales bacterium]
MPKKKETGYRLLLQWAALPVTDRRWAAPLAAVALGFGLFVGVAIGPGTSGSFAGGAPQVIALAGGEGDGDGEAEETGFSDEGEEGGGEFEESFEEEPEAESSFEPFEEEPFEEAESGEDETTPPARPEKEDEAEPAEEELLPLSGTVVHVNPAAGSYTVAESSGALSAVHAKALPQPGAKLSVGVKTLANGTYAEGEAAKKSGTATTAKLEGIVTWVDADPAAPAYVVSKRGVSVLVKVHPDPAGVVPALPALGAFAKVGVEIEKLPAASPAAPLAPAVPDPAAPLCEGAPLVVPAAVAQTPAAVATLWQTSLDASGVPFTYSDVAGVVTAVCAQEKTLLLSADDLRQAGADLVIAVPPKLATAKLVPGMSVLATADIGAAGELTLKGLASDERAKGADDAAATQGDLVNHLDE